MDPTSQLRQIQKDERELNLRQVQHTQQLNQITQLEKSVLTALSQLVKYLDGHTTKTEIVNQLKEIGTPDALKVVSAVNELHSTLKTHKNTDLSEVSTLLKKILAEQSKPAKEIKFPEQKDTVKVSNLEEISVDNSDVVKAIKGIKLNVESPKVDVKAPIINVETDLKPVQTALLDVLSAIKDIKIPETPKTDLSKVEKNTTEANKLLQKIVDKRSGGGGGGSGAAFINPAGNLVHPTLDTFGSVPTFSNPFAMKITVAGTVTYIAKALPGTAQSSPVWQVQKVDETTGTVITWCDGNSLFDNIATDLTALTYS